MHYEAGKRLTRKERVPSKSLRNVRVKSRQAGTGSETKKARKGNLRSQVPINTESSTGV